MIIGVPSETKVGEARVALVPEDVAKLTKAGHTVKVQSGAGAAAGHPDAQYEDAGATVVADRADAFDAQVVAQVRCFGANEESGGDDLQHLNNSTVLVGHCEPLIAHEQTNATADTGVTLLAMELVPRITRAQALDALSSQANLAGYKAVIIAAEKLGKILPMMMTAAGTLKPTRVFVVGAGVAGLQAIATAKRLGAVVLATDVRPEVGEQIESLGGRFVMHEELMVESEGGYAKELTDEQKAKQRELVSETVAESDVVITTAAIPGRPSPRIIFADMVERMKPGSIIVDLAAERGGNCELTKPDEEFTTDNGVTIIGTLNIPATVAAAASRMYSGNVTNLLKLIADKEGNLTLDAEDEVIKGMLVAQGGNVVNERVLGAMGNAAPPPATAKQSEEAGDSEPDGDSAADDEPEPAPAADSDTPDTDDADDKGVESPKKRTVLPRRKKSSAKTAESLKKNASKRRKR